MKANKKLISCVLGAVFSGASLMSVFANDVQIVISEIDNSIVINNVENNVIGISVTVPVNSSLSNILEDNFNVNSNFNGFISTNSNDNSVTFYVANDSDLRENNSIDIGILDNISDIDFGSSGIITTTDFLYNETSFNDVSIDISIDEKDDNDGTLNDDSNNNYVPNDEDDDDFLFDNDNNDQENNSSSGSSSNSSSGNSSSSSSGSSSSVTNNSSDSTDEEDDKNTESNSTNSTDTTIDKNNSDYVDYENIINSFSDVKNHWASESIAIVVSKGLFAGVSDSEFAPNNNMTRAMFVTVLSRITEIGEYSNTKFSDIPDNQWYTDAVNWAFENNITSGISATTFAPDNNVTREQMAVFLYNYVKAFDIDLPLIEDKEIFVDDNEMSSWSKEAIYIMQQADILNGKSNNDFDPQGFATRAEVATMIAKFIESI